MGWKMGAIRRTKTMIACWWQLLVALAGWVARGGFLAIFLTEKKSLACAGCAVVCVRPYVEM